MNSMSLLLSSLLNQNRRSQISTHSLQGAFIAVVFLIAVTPLFATELRSEHNHIPEHEHNGVCGRVASLQKNVYQSIANEILLRQSGYLSSTQKYSTMLSAQQRESVVKRKPYDVLQCRLFMDWRQALVDSTPQGRMYNGSVALRLRIDSADTRILTLNADSLRIDSIFVDNIKLAASAISAIQNEEFRVSLPSSKQAGSILNMNIYYTHIRTRNAQDGGFYSYKKGPRQNADPILENICYTMSQPNDARGWMPCNDAPYDKLQAQIAVRLPEGYTLCSNGLLDSTQSHADGSTTQFWSDTTPIPTYLMVAVASKFYVYSDWYKPKTNPIDSIPVPFYQWADDTNNVVTGYRAFDAQKNTVKMMHLYADQYGPYPFRKYGTASIYPFQYGGMEHQTMTTNSRVALRGAWENVIAHELMHQWTGDKVTCASWNDIWLNEGGATFGEYLWLEATQGEDAARTYFASRRNRDYFRNNAAATQPAVYGIDISVIFNTGTTYVKAGWVYHMLRRMLGDTEYFRVMKLYLNRFAYQSIETEDMITFLEQNSPNPPVPFRTFFEQWIYSRGHPVYSLNRGDIVEGNNRFQTTMTLTQSQSGQSIPDVFEMPVRLRFKKDTQVYDTTVHNSQRVQTFLLSVPFLASTAEVDPLEYILCQKDSSALVVSVDNSSATTRVAAALTIYPNPATNTIAVEYQMPVSGTVTIDISDISGKNVLPRLNLFRTEGLANTIVDIATLPMGTYSLRLTLPDGTLRYAPFVIEGK